MSTVKRWSVDIFLWEDDAGHTSAEARLISDQNAATVIGRGTAKLNPRDVDVPEIGDEVAVGRALADLGAHLMSTAQADITAVAQAE